MNRSRVCQSTWIDEPKSVVLLSQSLMGVAVQYTIHAGFNTSFNKS